MPLHRALRPMLVSNRAGRVVWLPLSTRTHAKPQPRGWGFCLFTRLRMSAFGTKRTFAHALHMSAFGGKADMTVCIANVCF